MFPPEPLPVEGGRDKSITGSVDGTTVSQSVADPQAEVQILVLPQSDEAMIDAPFRFAIRAIGDPARSATNTRIRLGVKLRRADGTEAPPGEVAFTRAWIPQAQGQPRNCDAAGNDRVCMFGDIAPGGQARMSGELRTSAAARPGTLVLTVRARLGATELKPSETIVNLVPRRQLSNVGLALDLSSDADVAVMGHDFVHTITIRNTSTEDATRAVLDIRQRAVTPHDGASRLLAASGMEVSGLDQLCARQREIYRCSLGTVKAGQEIRIPVRVKILKDLPGRRSGKVETQARVKSAEIDPDPGDNVDKTITTLVSRQPVLAFLAPVVGESGQVRFVEQDSLPNGERFGIGARFMHVVAEPGASELVVRLAVSGAQPVDVVLRPPRDGQGRIYRSGPLRLLPPGAPANAADTPIRAKNGDELRASYERSSATARVTGHQ